MWIWIELNFGGVFPCKTKVVAKSVANEFWLIVNMLLNGFHWIQMKKLDPSESY